jgi:hypothetical protein
MFEAKTYSVVTIFFVLRNRFADAISFTIKSPYQLSKIMLTNYKRGLCILSTAALMIAVSTLNGQNYKWGVPAVFDIDDQVCSDVATDGAGNVYMAGSYETEAIFDQTATIYFPNADYPSAAYTDGFLAKYDRANGDVIWALQFAQTSPATAKNERVSAVAVYPDGLGSFNLYVVGTYTSSLTLVSWNDPATFNLSGTGQAGFIAKYNADGVVQWAYTIDGSGTDNIYDVCVTSSNVSVCGSFTGSSINCSGATQGVSVNTTAGGNPGGTEAFLMHFTDGGSTANPTWARAMWAPGNDAFYAMATTDNGDIVATGMLRGSGTIHTNNTFSTTGVACSGADAFVLARYSATGAHAHTLSGGGATTGTGWYDAGLAAAIDVNGDAYIAGYFSGTCTFGSNSVNNLGAAGTHDIFIAKVNSGGVCTYLRGGGTANDGDAIQSIVVNNLASRVYVTGNFKGNLQYDGSGTLFSSYSSSNIDGFLLSLNASDLTRISGGETKFGGSSHDDNGRAIAINAAEDIYIGSSVSSASWSIGASSALMYNTNTNGGTYEAALLRWDHSNWPAYTNSFTTTHKGVGEWWNASAGAWKISMVGSFHSSVGNPVSFPNCASMASTQDASGNYTTNDAFLTTCSTFGDYESFVRLMNGNGDEAVHDHTTDASGNNYFTGYGPTSSTQVLSFVGGSSYSTARLNTSFVGKYNNAGNYTWGVFIAPDNSASSVEAEGITVDNSGNVYVTGAFSGTVTFGTQSPVTSVGPGSFDLFVAKYNSSGVFQWAVQFGSKAYEKGYSISVDNAGNYYVTGNFNGQASDALTMGNTLNGSGNADIFVMKGAVSNGAAAKSIKRNSGASDIGKDVISPNSSECYITGSYNNGSQCFTGSVNFSPATPTWNWTATNTIGSGYVSAVGTDLVMGNNGYIFVSGYATGNNILAFGALAETVSNGAFLVSYSSWGGAPTCMETYILPLNSLVFTEGIALETGVNSPDHGDNVLVVGSKGSVVNNNEAYAHKITTEGCAVSERRPNPVIPSTVSESALYGSLVYPNPLNGKATLEIRTDADFSSTPLTVVITDMTGREVSRINGITTKLVDINAENFSDGLYYYQVIRENKMISNGKMVVSH